MALIVEDGTGVENADTYVSVADHVAYCLLYGITVTNADAEINLRKAMDYMSTFNYAGNLLYTVNALPFPRTLIYYNRVLLTDVNIMNIVRKAQNEIAKSIKEGFDPLARTERLVKTKKFGPFEKTFEDGDSSDNPRVDVFLQPLLAEPDGGGIHFRVATRGEYYGY